MNHADQIAHGSGVLARRAGAWLAGDTWRSLALRGGTVAYVGPHVLLHLSPYPLLVPAALAAWLAWSWWAGRAAAPEPEPAEDPPPAAAPPPLSAEQLHTAATEVAAGGSGAHVAALAEHLTTDPQHPVTAADVRAALAAHAVPVSPSVRQPGRGVSTGVRLADLPHPSPAAPVAVVPAGQAATTGRATGAATPLVVEYQHGVTIVRDRSEDRRTSLTKTE